MYLVGEPILTPTFKDEYLAPVGQARACYEILRKYQSKEQVLEQMRKEYLAIVYALKKMEIPFQIIFSHKEKIDMLVLNACIQGLNCRLAGIDPGFSPEVTIFPRDLWAVFTDCAFINQKMAKMFIGEKDGFQFFASLLGEGGRVLPCKKTMVVCDHFNLDDKKTVPVLGLEEAHKMGIAIGLHPQVIAQKFTHEKLWDAFTANDHIDRTSALLEDEEGKLHLVVDPWISGIDWTPQEKSRWVPLSPAATIRMIQQCCETIDVQVEVPAQMNVPYALNLIQFPDRHVLMTAGDPGVQAKVESIVGRGNVSTTEVPIVLLPIFLNAGIRCMINEEIPQLFTPKVDLSKFGL